MIFYVMSFVGVERQPILDFIDTIPEIVDWHASTGAIFMKSEKTAEWLTDKIHEKFTDAMFIISPMSIRDVQGWASPKTWNFLLGKK